MKDKEKKKANAEGTAEKKPKKKKRLKLRVSIRVFFTMLIIVEVILGIGIALLILSELSSLLPISIRVHPSLLLIGFSLIVGIISASYINNKIFSPVLKISRAMTEVADGDLSVSLETESRIKEIQDIYESFNLMVRELSANEMVGEDFISNVSHEFKTPIGAIEGYATLLGGPDVTPEERSEYAEKIIYSAKRLSDLASDILLISKIDNQAIDSGKRRYRLDEQIRQAILLLEPKWTEKEIEFDVDLEDTEYTCSESLMLHVWTNLLDNAIKFDPKGGYVGVRLTKDGDGDGVTVTVSDGGPGIPDGEKAHIFEKFYQSDSSHKDEGSGLGLALVARILAASGGSVTVSDRSPCGSVFTVKLPGR